MSSFPKCRVSFRICDEKLDPMEITKILHIEPDASHKNGDPRTSVSKKGKLIKYSPYNSGLWSIDSKKAENASLEEHINDLLLLLEPAKDKIIVLSSQGYKIDFFCGLFAQDCPQPGFGINSNILKRVGDLNISIEICFYYES